jgi:hypothetical protein
MSRLAVHMRIANVEPTNDEVTSRQQAITALTLTWRSLDDLGDIVLKANRIAIALGSDGNPAPELGEEVQSAIQQTAPAYLYEERPLDVGICAGLSALTLVTEDAGEDYAGMSHRDIFSAVLWSALSYQPELEEPRREALRAELRDACSKRCADAAEAARCRVEVEEFDAVDTLEEEETLDDVRHTAASAIAALKHNATLDREELNFLWWALLNRSRLLKRPLSGIPEPVRLVACAIEGAQYLTALPAEVHRDLALRTLDADPTLTHEALLKKVGADRAALNEVFGEVEIVAQAPEAFPVLHSLKVAKASLWGAAISRSSSEWASRVLLEAAIAQLYLMESV